MTLHILLVLGKWIQLQFLVIFKGPVFYLFMWLTGYPIVKLIIDQFKSFGIGLRSAIGRAPDL